MKLSEIKDAVDRGETVHWVNSAYIVTKSDHGYYISCVNNGSSIGLTWADGKTLNGKESEFYLK